MIERALGMDEEQTAKLYKQVMTEGWCRALPAYEGAKEAVAEMRQYADVIPVTAHETAELLREARRRGCRAGETRH